jgi:hypothetical protein
VEAARNEFSADDIERSIGGLWTTPVQHFFRQSGLYQQIFAGQDINESFADSFREALQRRTQQVTYLAPIDLIEFDQDVLDFGYFQIRCITEDELDKLLKQNIRKLFYPAALVNSRQLDRYWFVVASETLPLGPLSELERIITPQVTLRYSPFPVLLERIFRRLVLYPFPNPFAWPTAICGNR